MSSLPPWVNKAIYRDTPLTVLQINLGAIRAQLGYSDRLAEMADSAGIPDKPPAWVCADSWDAFIALLPTPQQMNDLTEDIFQRSRSFAASEMARRREVANCEHDWNVVHGVRTKACKKCGRVEDVIGPKLILVR